jgi:hypothetical protein
MAGEIIKVHGLRELEVALSRYNRDVKKTVNHALREAAEPVRAGAEGLALSEIRNLGPRWSRMKVGVTSKLVYVAPATRPRGGGSARPNLAPLLMDRAMQPALEQRSEEVYAGLELAVDRLGEQCGF